MLDTSRATTATDSQSNLRALVVDNADVLFIWFIGIVAVLARFTLLDSLPDGLHGDEGSTGLDARRIIDEGSIGPYTPSALGQPAGPMYVAAVFVKLLGSEIVSVRAPMATMGVATV